MDIFVNLYILRKRPCAKRKWGSWEYHAYIEDPVNPEQDYHSNSVDELAMGVAGNESV